tara:strand:+ start:518 stop:1174 length:657 start_codon:yes stop_codon:yes gene_type:complete
MAKGGKLVMDRAIIAGDPSLGEIVYCYQFPSRRDRIKIGYSSRGLRRIVEQSTGFPENPEVLFVIHDPRAAMIEKELHASLSDKQAAVLGREWFGANIRDVLAVSPILRKAAHKQRWRSIPRLFGAGALFGLGMFFMPIIALMAVELMGQGADLVSWQVAKDYLFSPFASDVKTVDTGKAVLLYLWQSQLPIWLRATVVASPAIWVGLAYVSFRKQVA